MFKISFLYLLLSLLLLPYARAQDLPYSHFPMRNAKWTVIYDEDTKEFGPDGMDSVPLHAPWICHYSLGSDSLINNKIYSTLYCTYNSKVIIQQPFLMLLYREDSNAKRILKYQGATEGIYYDFGVAPLDTLCNIGYMGNHPGVPCFKVDSIGNTSLVSGQRRSYYISWASGGGGYEKWIEGIGTNRGILHPLDCTIDRPYTELVCFEQNGIVEYINPKYKSCGGLVSIQKQNIPPLKLYWRNDNELLLMMNTPTYNSISDYYVKILNMSGQVVHHQDIASDVTLISLEKLPRSIYVIQLSSSQGIYYTTKVTKQ